VGTGESGRYHRGILRLVGIFILVPLLAACDPAAAYHQPLTPEGNITLPTDVGQPGYDLLALDSRVGKLYVAHSSRAAMDVVDLRTKSYAGSVQGLVGIKDIAVTNDPNIVFTSDADGNVAVVDVPHLKVLKMINLGGSPDSIAFDPVHNVVSVTLSSDKQVALIDAAAEKLLSKIPIPGDPELTTVDPDSGMFYQAIHDKDEVVVIDPVSRSITKTYKGCDIKLPTGMAFDPDRSYLFVAGNANLSIIDTVLDRCLGGVFIGHGTDQIAFNAHTHHVYTADGSSKYVSVVDSASLKPLGTSGTGRSASSIAVDPTTDMVYVLVKPAGLIAVYHDP
jgi:DNA-binding beta-propeller fold protein YncE